jgi:hypothetical protein
VLYLSDYDNIAFKARGMDVIARNLSQAFTAEKVALLRNIAADYDLNPNELIAKYIDGNITIATPRRTNVKTDRRKKKNDYIEVDEYVFKDIKYLVDTKNNIYTYNIEKPMLIGEKLVDGSIKFYDGYITGSC